MVVHLMSSDATQAFDLGFFMTMRPLNPSTSASWGQVCIHSAYIAPRHDLPKRGHEVLRAGGHASLG